VVSSACGVVTRGPRGVGDRFAVGANQKAAVTIGVRGPRSLRSLEAPVVVCARRQSPRARASRLGRQSFFFASDKKIGQRMARTIPGFTNSRNHFGNAHPARGDHRSDLGDEGGF
jgi:hypothetical protein